MPLQQVAYFTVGAERWWFKIVASNPNATADVLAENMFNDPPAPGFQFFLTTVQVGYISGTAPENPYYALASRLQTVGASNVSYTQYNPGCGVTPDDLGLKATSLFPGGTISGNLCWSVSSLDANSLVGYFPVSNGVFWMALK